MVQYYIYYGNTHSAGLMSQSLSLVGLPQGEQCSIHPCCHVLFDFTPRSIKSNSYISSDYNTRIRQNMKILFFNWLFKRMHKHHIILN